MNTKAGFDSVPGLLGTINRRLGGVPTHAFPVGGPATRALVTTVLGTGLGYLGGKYVLPYFRPVDDPRRAGRFGAVLGGLATLGLNSPVLVQQYRDYGLLGLNSTPESRTKAAFKISMFSMPHPDHGFSASHARQMLAQAPGFTFQQRVSLMRAVPPPPPGMLTAGGVARAAAGGAIGGVGAAALGATLGTLFGLPMSTRRRITASGALAGAVLNSGALTSR